MAIPTIDYVGIVACLACAAFFAKGAQLEGRSTLAWGGASLALWLGATLGLGGGMLAGFLSQAALFAGLTLHSMRRQATRPPARD
jgi:hypothetical protein